MRNLPKKPKLKYFDDEKNKKAVSVRLHPKLIARLKKEAEDTGYTQAQIFEFAVDQYLQESDKK